MPNSNDLREVKSRLWQVRDAQGVETVREFVTMKIEMLKDDLCVCSTEQAVALQGQVAAYRELIAAIDTEPHQI